MTPLSDDAQRGATAAVEIDKLTKNYGDRTVLDKISLRIEPGSIFGLLGPNGAGKSTLLESIAGLRKPTLGQVRVLGIDPRRDRKVLTTKVPVQPQSANVFGYLTVLETIRLYASFHQNHKDVRETIHDIGLNAQIDVQARNLSGGQLRRLLLGVAVIGGPELVILDEPSAGLDPEARRGLLQLVRGLKGEGTTVVFSTHDMVEATQVCDRVVILADGQVRADGSPESLVDSAGKESTLCFDVDTEASLQRARAVLGNAALTWRAEAGGYRLTYKTPDPDTALEALTRDREIRGRHYRIERTTLEDFYLAIVEESRNQIEGSDVHA